MSKRPARKQQSPRKGVRPTRKRGRQTDRPTFLSDGQKGTRLQKFLANAGVDSRRNCEEFIRSGRVTVDGAVVTNPATSVHPEEQDVQLDGEKLQLPKYRYLLLNKPKGVVCTNRDPAGRPRAVDLVPADDQKMFTVGRLDENTEGLLLITNDGALAEHLAHPRYEVTRTYRAQVAGVPEADTLKELQKGMHFSDGYFRFHNIRQLKSRGRSAFLELELREGKNREIRRLLARVGHKVIHLQRVGFGPLRIGRLEVGNCRELKPQELSDLYEFISTAPEKRSSPRRPRRKPESGQKKSATGRDKSAAGKHSRNAPKKSAKGKRTKVSARGRRGAR